MTYTTRSTSEAQANYLTAKAMKDAAWDVFSTDGGDDASDLYLDAAAHLRTCENELFAWAKAQMANDKRAARKYAMQRDFIENAFTTRIPSFRARVIELCLSLEA